MPSGVYVRTKKHREKISKSLLGHPFYKGMTGRKHTQETKKKMSLSAKNGKTGKYKHTLEHNRSISLAHKRRVALGLNNFWKGGITPIHYQIRHSIEYKLWRQQVFERDNYTYVWCGAKNGLGKTIVLNADHIKPFSLFPELRLIIENGRTLCKPCHKTTNTYGRPKDRLKFLLKQAKAL